MYTSYLGSVPLDLTEENGQLLLQLQRQVGGRTFTFKVVDARDHPARDFTQATLAELKQLPCARLPRALNATAFKASLQLYRQLQQHNRKPVDARLLELESAVQLPADSAAWCRKLCGSDGVPATQSLRECEGLYAKCCEANAGPDVLYNMLFFLEYLYSEFGQVGISSETTMLAVVNVPKLDNAFFSPQKFMCYGAGDEAFRALVAPDITFHELAHGLTETFNGLAYEGESGALNECFSDVVAAAAEFQLYATHPEFKGEADWDIGEDATRYGRKLRNMQFPETGMSPQPAEYGGRHWVNPLDLRNDHGGVHTNSGVGNKLFYLVAQRYADVQRAAKLFVDAFKKLNRRSKYAHLADTLLQADPDLRDVLAQVKLAPPPPSKVPANAPPPVHQPPPLPPQNLPGPPPRQPVPPPTYPTLPPPSLPPQAPLPPPAYPPLPPPSLPFPVPWPPTWPAPSNFPWPNNFPWPTAPPNSYSLPLTSFLYTAPPAPVNWAPLNYQ